MKIVYAMTTAQVALGGAPTMVRHGSHWRADDPVVLAHPSLFSDDPRYGLSASSPSAFADEDVVVEQATAAPGEKRQMGRR